MKFPFKKIEAPICIALVIALGFGGFMGVKNMCIKQRTIDVAQSIETVNDEVSQSKTADSKGGPKIKAKAAVLIDSATGKVIYALNADKELPPASVTKVMTMLLAMEAVDSGKITLDDEVTISDNAASMGGSQMYMEPGETHTVAQLLEGVAMVSANDGCVALAEYIAGSTDIFVEKMNKKAQELGMKNTNFVNTNGLPVREHYTSAYDIALMSKELIKHKEIRKWCTKWQDTIKVGLPGKETEFGLTNTNKMIKTYNGANGIKTGFTQEAGYCLSTSATRGNTTLIAVVLGAKTSKERNAQVAKLLDYGFSAYETAQIFPEGEAVKKVPVDRGEPEQLKAVTGEAVAAFIKKGDKEKVTHKIVIDKDISPPLKKGDAVGRVDIYYDGQKTGSVSLVSDRDVRKASFITYYARSIRSLFGEKQ